jgi:hypothetical protein
VGTASEEIVTPKSLTTLLAGIVDYAGLFPPAALSMVDAVHNYAQYLNEPESWALGRFIVPVACLSEFERVANSYLSKNSSSSAWKLSALGGSNTFQELKAIFDFNSRYLGKAQIDTIETKATRVEEIRRTATLIRKSVQLFIEVPIHDDPGELIQVIADAGVKAKVRTGGVTVDAFPSSDNLARFIHACVKANVQFKATAGLHHPLRAIYNLTYTPDSERGKMFGFLNVFLAAAFLGNGMSVEDAKQLVEEESFDAFGFDDTGVTWRSHRLDTDALKSARTNCAASFGSCSFREPVEGLQSVGLL